MGMLARGVESAKASAPAQVRALAPVLESALARRSALALESELAVLAHPSTANTRGSKPHNHFPHRNTSALPIPFHHTGPTLGSRDQVRESVAELVLARARQALAWVEVLAWAGEGSASATAEGPG